MKRYQVALKWFGPQPMPNKRGRATYIIDVTEDDTVADAVRSAIALAPRVDPAASSPHWSPIEVWRAVPLINIIDGDEDESL